MSNEKSTKSSQLQGYEDGVAKAGKIIEECYQELGIEHVKLVLDNYCHEKTEYNDGYKKGIHAYVETFEKNNPKEFQRIFESAYGIQGNIQNIFILLNEIELEIGSSINEEQMGLFSSSMKPLQEFVNNIEVTFSPDWCKRESYERKSVVADDKRKETRDGKLKISQLRKKTGKKVARWEGITSTGDLIYINFEDDELKIVIYKGSDPTTARVIYREFYNALASHFATDEMKTVLSELLDFNGCREELEN